MCRLSLLLQAAVCFSVLCWHRAPATDELYFMTAVNIKWSSINFKTILEWQPVPTNHSYTVEVSGKKPDWKTKCLYTMSTECDVTDLLDNLKDTYHAQIVSTIQANKDTTEEFPFSVSPPFVPYEETIIGKPGIEQYKLYTENDTLQVTIVDPITPYRFPNNSLQSIRDIFKDDLRYTVYFWKASSTGKKSATTQSNEFVIRVDKGESYCFYVQATIMSRKLNRESQETETHCTTNGGMYRKTLPGGQAKSGVGNSSAQGPSTS
ncbi:hypothetical protein FKM82_002125, partial [Ascaphus truei]